MYKNGLHCIFIFSGITWPDYLVIVAYFAFVLAVGLFSSWKSNRDSVEGYFLSSRSMSFIPVRAMNALQRFSDNVDIITSDMTLLHVPNIVI